MVAKAAADGDGAAESSKCWCGHQVASLRGQLPAAKVIECGARLQESPGQPDPLLQEDQSSRCTCRGSPSAIMYALMVDQTIGSTRVVRGNASLSGVQR